MTEPSVAVTREVRLVKESAFAVIAVQFSSMPDKSTALIAAPRELTSEERATMLALS